MCKASWACEVSLPSLFSRVTRSLSWLTRFSASAIRWAMATRASWSRIIDYPCAVATEPVQSFRVKAKKGVWQSQDRMRVCATLGIPWQQHFDSGKKLASKFARSIAGGRAQLPIDHTAHCPGLHGLGTKGSSKERSCVMAGDDPSITIEHVHVKRHSGNKGHKAEAAILASRQRQTKEMIMTKCMKVLFAAALSVAVAQPALAHCGSPHAKTSRATVA